MVYRKTKKIIIEIFEKKKRNCERIIDAVGPRELCFYTPIRQNETAVVLIRTVFSLTKNNARRSEQSC